MLIKRKFILNSSLLVFTSALPYCGSQPATSELTADNSTPATTGELSFECKESEGDLGDKKAEAVGINGDKFKVKASWCYPPKSVGKANVLLIVDFSGSMSFSDPLVNGSCGRLDAAKALVAKFKSDKKQKTDDVQVAIVGFSDEAKVLNDFQAIEQVESSLTANNLCLAQQGTMYSAAFQTASTTLEKLKNTDLKAPVYTYFVTDGYPSDPEELAFRAATDFKKAVTDIHASSMLSAIFLKMPPSTLGAGQPPFPTDIQDPESILETITGDKSRVRIANNAAELAGKIADLSVPTASIDPSTVKVLLSSKAGEKTHECNKDIECQVEVDPKDTGKWSIAFSFPLSGEEGKKIGNIAEIVGKRTDGSEIKAKAIVTFSSMR